MKKSFIGGMALGAFLVSLISNRVQTDEKTGYAFAIPPSGLDEQYFLNGIS